jgi:sortase A
MADMGHSESSLRSRVRTMTRLTYPDIARIFGTGLISTGIGLLAFVAITVVWGDPFTRATASAQQEKLGRTLDAGLPPATSLGDAGLDPLLTRQQAALARKATPLGSAAGRIRIPAIGLNKVFVHGARDGTPDLTKGPGLYRETPFPGSGRPIAIAGHRTTFGAPFLNVDQLKARDTIVLQMPYGTFTYRITDTRIISPSDWSIISYGAAEPTAAMRKRVLSTGQCVGTCEHLVLTACHPKYSAAQRIAVFARLSSVQLASQGGS